MSRTRSPRRWAVPLATGILLLWTAPAWADAAADADRVFLQQDCTGLSNCFEDVRKLENWLWDTRQPSEGDEVIVDVGPGTYPGFKCQSSNDVPLGWVTLRGAGPERTVFERQPGFINMSIYSARCESLGFQDLAAEAGYAVFWVAGGSSTWTNVELRGKGDNALGWYDFNCDGSSEDPSPGEHFFFGSRIVSDGNPFFAECDLSWVYGSDVLSHGAVGVAVSHRGDVRLFGSTLRVTGEDLSSGSSAELRGASVGPIGNSGVPEGFGEFHMHGGIINVSAASHLDAGNVTAVKVNRFDSGTGRAHVLDTAFVVQPGPSGTATRVSGEGVQSAFQWQAGEGPPVADLQSEAGQDAYVETDCASDGNCEAGGTDPHLMLYKSGCGASNPWFDVVTGRCRNDTGS